MQDGSYLRSGHISNAIFELLAKLPSNGTALEELAVARCGDGAAQGAGELSQVAREGRHAGHDRRY